MIVGIVAAAVVVYVLIGVLCARPAYTAEYRRLQRKEAARRRCREEAQAFSLFMLVAWPLIGPVSLIVFGLSRHGSKVADWITRTIDREEENA